ncbi:MAG: radical SAM protein [Desulfobacterales bacterium]
MQQTKEQIILENMQEYGEIYPRIRWISPEEAARASLERAELLRILENGTHTGCQNTKLYRMELSPGCQICTQGTWSCLFINGKCPCRCFHCPAEQSRNGVPTTNSVPFHNPAEYVSYLEKFGFRGAALSGGEPFGTFPLTLRFVTAIKKKFGSSLYLWMYTSGVFVNEENLKKLRDAGLDELRFNIGATQYRLDNARKAVGMIDRVTVEIPAVPEEFELLKQKIREMRESGISYLNLHQLRLTPHNCANLIQRPYTFLHGKKVTVAESELTALRLLCYAAENAIALPINYCSFVYKNRFQTAAFRKRNAAAIRKSHEDITESGYIRTISLAGESNALVRHAEDFSRKGADPKLWFLTPAKDRLYFSESLSNAIGLDDVQLFAGYSEARILPSVSYHNPFAEISLTRNKKVFVEKMRVQEPVRISPEILLALREKSCPEQEPARSAWEQIRAFEAVPSGLQEYF